MTTLAWWTSFSNHLMQRVRQHTFVDGSGMLDTCVLDCVLLAGGLVAVATVVVLEYVLLASVSANTCALAGALCCRNCCRHWGTEAKALFRLERVVV